MDALSEEGLPDEGQDREAAAALAEMAAALAEAAIPAGADGAMGAESPETPAEASEAAASAPAGRLTKILRRRPRIDIRRISPRRPSRPAVRLDRSKSRRLATELLLAATLVLAFSGSAAPRPAGIAAPTRAPVAAAGRTPGPSAQTPTPPASSPSVAPEASVGTASPETPEPNQSIPPQTSPTATITFTDLVVDSALDFPHSARVFTFTSDGPGAVTAQVTAGSPMDSSDLCVTADDGRSECDMGATPSLTLVATGPHNNWKVAVLSGNSASATVDVQFSWPTASPQITVDHARFQGYPNSDSLRSLSAVFKTRSAGRFSLGAAWPGASARTTLTLTDVSGRREATIDTSASAEARPSTDYAHFLNGGRIYVINLFNDSPDDSRPDLKATISFP